MDNENAEVEEAQVEEAPEAAATPPEPVVEEPASSEPGPSPWQSDLEAAFEEPELRSRVDEYLRQNVQPYVTQLEQKSAPVRDANRLWESFHEDPAATFEQVAREIHGDEAAERIIAALSDEDDGEDDDYDDLFDEDDEDSGKEYPPEIQALIEDRQRQQYEQVIDGVKEQLEKDGLPFHRQQFEPYIVAHDGNLDEAIAAYRAWIGEAKELFGIKVPKPEDVPPPPAINSETRAGGSMTPPVEESYRSLDDAVDAFFKEQNTAPPNVGAV